MVVEELVNKREKMITENKSTPDKLALAKTAIDVFKSEIQLSYNKAVKALKSVQDWNDVGLQAGQDAQVEHVKVESPQDMVGVHENSA
jgi:hypothetical protein